MTFRQADVFIQVKHSNFAPIHVANLSEAGKKIELGGAGRGDDARTALVVNRVLDQLRGILGGLRSKSLPVSADFNSHSVALPVKKIVLLQHKIFVPDPVPQRVTAYLYRASREDDFQHGGAYPGVIPNLQSGAGIQTESPGQGL